MSNNTGQLADELQDLMAQADREGRALSPAEYAHAYGLREQIKGARAPNIPALDHDAAAVFYGGAGPVGQGFAPRFKTLGEAFTESDGYKHARSASGKWSTGAVSVAMKGTLLEGAGGGGGAIAVTVPQVVDGYVPKLFQPLVLEDLLLSGQATTATVRYVTMGTATSGAAGVAEGGLKPESTLGFTTTDEAIKKIATVLKVSDEVIEDAPAIQQVINGQLGLFVRIEAERQLLRGTAGGDEVQGLLTSRSVPVYAGGTAAGNKAVQVFKAMNGMRGSAFVEPEWVIMHPTDYQEVRLLTDTAGQFFAGGPFATGAYGGGQTIPASGQITGAADTLWGKPVYISSIVGSGTAVVGNRESAQVWSRGGLSVEASNSDGSDFIHNLVAIRAERRLGLSVFRPGGFVEVRLA